MTRPMLDSSRSTRAPAAGAPPRAVNGGPLRWTPGPDERRLPSSESEEDHVPWNTRQLVALVDSFNCLSGHWRDRPDVFVGVDQFVYWDPDYHPRTNTENPPAAPDVYVAFDVANRHRSSYVVWEEGKPPDFVLEVVSPSSRERDAKEKPGVYAKIGVPEFFLYDPGDEDGETLPRVAPALMGFELRGGKYRPLPEEQLPGGVSGVRSKVLGLCLCISRTGPEPLDGSLRWYDPVAGEFLRNYHQTTDDKRLADDNHRLADDNHRLADARREAEARAEASAARVAELEALVERMRRG